MLEVQHLNKEFPADGGTIVKAVNDANFTVPQGKVFTLLGPSGCGKTTTLRCIAGLERPSSGVIKVGDREVYNSEKRLFVQPNHRDIGMVFQSYAIWPHMNVFENVAFPLRVSKKRFSHKEIEERVARALATVQLAGYEKRQATKLSGGQQQRLALARALVREPSLLLLDEPLSNLDAKLRERMRFELKRLQRELGITTIYVTHDQMEALALSDVIAVMREGRIVQMGTPREIYERPNSQFVADFIGSTNFVRGRVADVLPGDRYRIETPDGELHAISAEKLHRGQEVLISVRPENVHLTDEEPERSEDENVWEVAVDTRIFLGEVTDYTVYRGKQMFRVRAHPSLELSRGQRVYARMAAHRCISVPLEGSGVLQEEETA